MTIGAVIHRFPSLPSTNDTARDLARSGAPHGTAVIAGEQSRGRGTKGRTWHSPAGLGLYASFILRPGGGLDERLAVPLLPLGAGLAASDAVQSAAGVSLRLKWPNDLVFNRLKVGGILVEAVSRGHEPSFVVIGAGINVNQSEPDFPPELLGRASSLRLITGRTIDRESLFENLCRTLEYWYNSLIRGAREAVLRAFEGRMAFFPGGCVRVSTSKGETRAVYLGLDSEGRLRLEASGGGRSIAFEEVRAVDWD